MGYGSGIPLFCFTKGPIWGLFPSQAELFSLLGRWTAKHFFGKSTIWSFSGFPIQLPDPPRGRVFLLRLKGSQPIWWLMHGFHHGHDNANNLMAARITWISGPVRFQPHPNLEARRGWVFVAQLLYNTGAKDLAHSRELHASDSGGHPRPFLNALRGSRGG